MFLNLIYGFSPSKRAHGLGALGAWRGGDRVAQRYAIPHVPSLRAGLAARAAEPLP
jgi:hypothetical protein